MTQAESVLWFVHYNRAGFHKETQTRINLNDNPSPTIMAEGIFGDCRSHYWLEETAMTRVIHDSRGLFSKGDVTDEPCNTIMATPADASHWQVVSDNRPEKPMQAVKGKPLYHVPLMTEIESLPWNGLKVASTFSGAGGSCLGYRMAGFKVVWANEFVPIAQDTYRRNHPSSFLETRDIKNVKPEDILKATGLKAGELDLFDGSPPCQAFSTAGKREKGWGKQKSYEHGATQLNETLFHEYIRLLRGLQPKVLVAENVSGLIKGTAKGWFLEILKCLKESGYRVKAKLLDAQWLGVPQARQRIIFIGVRNDLKTDPAYPGPMQYRYSVRDAIPWISNVRQHGETWKKGSDIPSPAIGASDSSRSLTARFSAGGWVDAEPISSCINDGPNLDGYAIAKEWDKLKPGTSSDKYLNLAKPHPDKPCQTVTASGGASAGIASVTHPTERRKFTIAELKRICAFPDDFVLTGSYAQQWERLGNSVPPLMMKAIAETLRDQVFSRLPGKQIA